jgi:hypothetical protein
VVVDPAAQLLSEGADSVPAVTDETRFWALIESAWAACGPAAADLRASLTKRDPAEDDGWETVETLALDEFLEQLTVLSADLTSAELTDLDRVVERLLFVVDRAEIQEYTDGSDDGFLYCRGFIVAMGREFYQAVDANPAVAVMDAEVEDMCYFFARLHNERFGSYPETGSGISRESCSNAAGWPQD